MLKWRVGSSRSVGLSVGQMVVRSGLRSVNWRFMVGTLIRCKPTGWTETRWIATNPEYATLSNVKRDTLDLVDSRFKLVVLIHLC